RRAGSSPSSAGRGRPAGPRSARRSRRRPAARRASGTTAAGAVPRRALPRGYRIAVEPRRQATRVRFTTRPELRGTFGMVASTHWLASSAGLAMLERGGNAFDAAAAAGFVLQVVEPHLNGPAGEAPLLLWSRKSQRIEVICGQ